MAGTCNEGEYLLGIRKDSLEKERQDVQRSILEEMHKVEEQITCCKKSTDAKLQDFRSEMKSSLEDLRKSEESWAGQLQQSIAEILKRLTELPLPNPPDVNAPAYVITVHHRLGAPDLALIDTDFDSGSSWTPTFDGHRLVMRGSGTSGLLRFRSSNGEEVGIAVGVHNYKRWCHIVTDFAIDETSHARRSLYYGGHDQVHNSQMWKQAESFMTVSSKGKPVSIDYFIKEGHNMHATVKYS